MTRGKNGGFYATRKAESRRRSLSLPPWAWALAVLALLLLAGLTPAWPQSSGLSSSSSGNDLTTWEQLSEQFSTALTGQSTRLEQALTELETSKADSLTLTGLLEQSLKANDSLRNYNTQIAERMQERDEELAAAYTGIHRLEVHRLKLIICIFIMGAVIAAIAAAKLLFRRGNIL